MTIDKKKPGGWPGLGNLRRSNAWLANAPLKFGNRDPKYKPSPEFSKVLVALPVHN